MLNYFREKVARLTLSRNQLVAQRGRHLLVLQEWFTADTGVAVIPIMYGKETWSSMGQRYVTKPVIVNRSAVERLKAAPVSADITAIAAMPAFTMRTGWHKLRPLHTSDVALLDQMVGSIAFALAADTDYAVEADTKFVGCCVLAAIVFSRLPVLHGACPLR
ncbi:hypothetical protein HDU86_007815 [Geranomyces michiganensis]|nr:hypothetical protein HDU86_007815 [Geranomyces michiganensis]